MCGGQRLRSEIVVLLAIKALALALIWYVFFSRVHRMHVDGEITGERFGLTAPANLLMSVHTLTDSSVSVGCPVKFQVRAGHP